MKIYQITRDISRRFDLLVFVKTTFRLLRKGDFPIQIKVSTLDHAQEAKLDLICQKLLLKPGMTVLDIGCGWGGFAKWAAEKYDVRVLGITVSQEQVKFTKEYCKELNVKIELQDYRDLKETFFRERSCLKGDIIKNALHFDRKPTSESKRLQYRIFQQKRS